MEVFLTQSSAKEALKNGISDKEILSAVARAEEGLIDAQIGPYLIKQRVARANTGRRGGSRTIIAFEPGRRAVFLHFFPKNAKSTLTINETNTFKDFSEEVLKLSKGSIAKLLLEKGWRKIDYEKPEEKLPE